jgi:glutaredoxin
MHANPSTAAQARCLQLEFYVQGSQPRSAAARDALLEFARQHPAISYREHDVLKSPAHERRVVQICQHFQQALQTPVVYGCGQPIVGFEDAANFQQRLKDLVTITVYVRSGCPHCADAKRYLPQLLQRFPGFQLQLKDVIANAQASREMQELVRKHRTAAASLPVFHICGELVIGFDRPTTTGPRLEAILTRWTQPCARADERDQGSFPRGEGQLGPAVSLVSYEEQEQADPSEAPLPLPGETSLPLPDAARADSITLPYFGEVRVDEIGLPLFTLAVGLVDGFNPCAMWVLMFLLSILVNLHSRWKILSVAGTFVLISGLAYFAFMAAWLNVFLLIGLLTWVRLTLACLAIAMGAIHVKDFFAFKQGITLSIPESAKPGIYQRVRRIVTAENLVGAVCGAAVLAVLVNIIELLCTAGLPALYTQILTAQQLPSWQNYAYLLLYILAYMLDDSLMVGVVVVTLERHKLQERHGRWLKLISGLAILALGIVMLLRPDWLGMSE